MASINLSFVHNRLKRGTSQKPVSIELRFSYKSERKYISTGIKVTPNQWSSNQNRIIRHKDAAVPNGQLEAFEERGRIVLNKMLKEGITDLSLIPALFNGEQDKNISFIDYCKKRMNERKVHDHTRKRYAVFIRFLQDWGKIISFSDCNVSKVRAMDEFLHKQGKAQCTICDYHKYLKLFINDAMTDGLLEQNPYKYWQGRKAVC